MLNGIVDSVHGFIPISKDMMRLIDLPIFQRLGRIRQLTYGCAVFPGANHTRKEHSIGAMFLAKKYSDVIFKDYDKYKQNLYKKTLEVAALYHDICHGPYSHSWDSVIYPCLYKNSTKGHDIHRMKVLSQYLSPVLKEYNLNPQLIRKIWDKKGTFGDGCDGNKLDNICDFSGFKALIHGPLGVDRMDFIKRDTTYTGTSHFGVIDISRIIYNTMFVAENTENGIVTYISYNSKIWPDILQGLRTRLDMYQQVYLHKATVASTILIELMIRESRDELDLVGRTKSLEDFVYLTDDILLGEILFSKSENLKTARILANALYKRKLPKMTSQRKIYVDNNNLYKPGVNIIQKPENDITELKATWRSRILCDDITVEFNKFNIHIFDDNKHIPFDKWHGKCKKPRYFYIEREYSYNL